MQSPGAGQKSGGCPALPLFFPPGNAPNDSFTAPLIKFGFPRASDFLVEHRGECRPKNFLHQEICFDR
jgi:hypothetical protein